MKLKPLHDRIIVEVAAKEEISAGGIILPDAAQEKPQRGTVLAVGPGKVLDSGKLAPVDINVGDVVLYGRYGGTEVTVSGKEYTILRAEDVLAIVSGIAAPRTAPKTAAKAVAKKPAAKKAIAKKASSKKTATKPAAKKAAPKRAAAKSAPKKATVKKVASKRVVKKAAPMKAAAKKSVVKKVAAKKPAAKKPTARKVVARKR